MNVKFLKESTVLMTDMKGLRDFVKRTGYGESLVNKILSSNGDLCLADGKPGYWFIKKFPDDFEKTIIVFSYSFDDAYGIKRDYITIYCHNIFAQSTSALFGWSGMTEEEIKKQSAIVRNIVKKMSKINNLKKMQSLLFKEESNWRKY